MGSFVILYVHVIFATKSREPFLTQEIEKPLRRYISGIGRNQEFSLLTMGGMPDHVHLLITLPATKSLSKIMHLLKGSSSKWMNDTFYPEKREFRWQGGYSAFSVSRSNVDNVKKYIDNQKQHHQNYTFEDENKRLLQKHGFLLSN